MLEWLLGPYREYRGLKLVYLGDWPIWVIVSATLIALAVVGVTLWGYARDRRWWQVGTLVVIRLVIVASVLLIFAQPALLKENVARSRNHIVVLVDASKSMTLPHGKQTRIDVARLFFSANRGYIQRLKKENHLHFFAFGDTLRPIDPASLQTQLSAKEKKTDLLAALRAVKTRFEAKDLGGILLLSDGIDTESFVDRESGAHEFSFDHFNLVREIGAPIHTFGFHDDDGLKDVAIRRLTYNDFAFIHNKVTVNAEIQVVGYPGREVPLELRSSGRLVRTVTLTIKPKQRIYRVAFELVLRRIGVHVFKLSAKRFSDELYHGNNDKRFLIKVLRDKIRVLQIAGRPSWDVRFMRSFLKSNPNIDLISFFIMVNPRSVYRLSSFETSLIPFPARELFVEQLGSFDLVIFQDFNYGPFSTRRHLHRVRQFVLKGGAFLMIGGSKAFTAGGYFGTDITDVLPVDIPPPFHPVKPLDEQDFQARLTPDGLTHPVTRLAFDGDENRRLWKNLPKLEGLNTSIGLRKDGISLLAHPSLKHRGKTMPVVALREVGKGRTMVFMTDSSWFWKLPFSAQRGGDSMSYNKFWLSAIRWLIKDESLRLIRLLVDDNSIRSGEKMKLTARVFNLNYTPAKDQEVVLTLFRRVDDQGSKLNREQRWKLKTDESGQIRIQHQISHAGVYEIRATARMGSHDEKVSTIVLVSDYEAEFERVVPDQRILQWIAKSSSGEHRQITDKVSRLRFNAPRVKRVLSRKTYELWNRPLILAVLLLLFSIEWILRRRLGYL